MKEVTRIATVRITTIEKVEDETQIIPKEESKDILANSIKELIECDDVVIDNIQDFIRDIAENGAVEDGRCEVDQDNN